MTFAVAPEPQTGRAQHAPPAYLFRKDWGDGKAPTIYLDCANGDTARVKAILRQHGVETIAETLLPKYTIIRISPASWSIGRTLGFTEFATEAERIANLALLDGKAPAAKSP